mmetsp:Transcript_1262/g.3527  ORF Transcript_1262/g.3527 Transcript_1262/m.3527 type:complete len:255 (+) Transcript_1262:111-875(+)
MADMSKLKFKGGERVIVDGLEARTDLNTKLAEVVSYDPVTERFVVSVLTSGERVRVKPANLTLTDSGATPAPPEEELTWWSELSEDMSYDWLIDCYRMRVDDDMSTGSYMHGLYAGDGASALLEDFLIFIKLASARGVAPPEGDGFVWAKLCSRAAKLLPNAFEKSDAAEKYGKVSANGAAYALRLMAEQVYGNSADDESAEDDPLYSMVRHELGDAATEIGEGPEGVLGLEARLFEGIGGLGPWAELRTALGN